MNHYSLSHLADHVLLRDLAGLVAQDRTTTAAMLAHLAEVDERKLYLPAAHPSMFAYCVRELRMSEETAFRRIRVARAARKFPEIFSALAAGRLNLTAVLLLVPHLSAETADELLAAASNKTKAEIERLVAERFPQPDLPARVDLLELAPSNGALDLFEAVPSTEPDSARVMGQLAPEPVVSPEMNGGGARSTTSLGPSLDRPRTRLAPLSPGRFALQLTISGQTHDKLRCAQALLGHAIPSGDVAQVLDRALDALIQILERRRFAASARSRPRRRGANERYVPAGVRREVWQRDQGRCTFVSDGGHRCEARTRLEYDHVQPLSRGGLTTAANLRLRCRAHNQYAAECVYGAGFMAAKRQQARDEAARVRARKNVASGAPKAHASATQPAPDPEVIPWLRALGFRADEARRAAACCGALPGAPLEERVRFALRRLAPASARRALPVAIAPA